MPLRFGSLALLAAAAPLLTSCVPETTLPEGTLVPTGVKIAPEDFLGTVQCADRPGGMQSYVATLVDVSEPEAPFVLPSSPPSPCSVPTDFRYLVVGHLYVAEIDGYSQPATALVPLNGDTSGSRHMLLKALPVQPRWSGECGSGDGNEAEASSDFDVSLRHCGALRDLQGSVSTGIEIDPTLAFTDTIKCGDVGGKVAALTVEVEGHKLAAQGALPCVTGESLPRWVFDTEIQTGVTYRFVVSARGLDKNVIATSTCTATAVAGLSTVAVCTDFFP